MPTFQPTFSIILPTKDRGRLLDQCVQSLIQQTKQDFEVIIVNDNSNDSIPNFAHSSIFLINNDGSGRSAARNTGLAFAKGKYICFVDDDDTVEPNFLMDFYNEIHKADENQIIRCRFRIVDEKGNAIKNDVPYNIATHKNALKYAAHTMCAMTTVCIPASIAKNHMFDERFYLWEDTHYLLRVFDEAERKTGNAMVQIKSINYNYQRHAQMTSQAMYKGKLKQMCEDTIIAIDDYFMHYKSNYLSNKDQESIKARKYLEYSVHAMNVKSKNLAFHYFKKSLIENISLNYIKEYFALFKSIF
jgi:glycosyltransferase involved in cell wall biosynthesis